MPVNYFGKNLSTLRKKKWLTQTELADELLMSRANIGSYEENRAEPNYNKLISIANFFEVTID